jgi:hypothetical protein
MAQRKGIWRNFLHLKAWGVREENHIGHVKKRQRDVFFNRTINRYQILGKPRACRHPTGSSP